MVVRKRKRESPAATRLTEKTRPTINRPIEAFNGKLVRAVRSPRVLQM